MAKSAALSTLQKNTNTSKEKRTRTVPNKTDSDWFGLKQCVKEENGHPYRFCSRKLVYDKIVSATFFERNSIKGGIFCVNKLF